MYLARSAAENLITSAGTYAIKTWHKVNVTKTSANSFSFYVNDTIVGTATDSNFTTATYMCFGMVAAGKIGYSDKKGDHSIIKKLGVD